MIGPQAVAVNKCLYCGRENQDGDVQDGDVFCRECGLALSPELRSPVSFWLWPPSREQWIRSLGYSLFAANALVLLVAVYVAFEGSSASRYASAAIGGRLLPMLGALILPFCIGARTLPKDFRILSLLVALISLGFLCLPQLAE